jgi:flagella basal body P-ring formation protein FlgA
MRCAVPIAMMFFPACLLADPPSAVIERLIAEAWVPQEVRVKWDFSEKMPSALTQHDDWRLAEPRATRLAGSMVLSVERRGADGARQRLAFSGTAHVFGTALFVKKRVNAGEPLDSANLEPIEAEWTRLNGQPLTAVTFAEPQVAVRALVPGRPILVQDVKAAPRVRRGQTVSLLYTEGNVHVRLGGRALQDGAAGDTISVAASLGKSRRFTGIVTENGTVLLKR